MKKKIIKYTGASILILTLVLLSQVSTYAQSSEERTTSLVIVKVEGLNAAIYDKLAAEILKHNELTLEYSCLESDVIIVKYTHNFSEKGDVQYYISSNFKKWGGVKNIKFVFIDLQNTGVSKC